MGTGRFACQLLCHDGSGGLTALQSKTLPKRALRPAKDVRQRHFRAMDGRRNHSAMRRYRLMDVRNPQAGEQPAKPNNGRKARRQSPLDIEDAQPPSVMPLAISQAWRSAAQAATVGIFHHFVLRRAQSGQADHPAHCRRVRGDYDAEPAIGAGRPLPRAAAADGGGAVGSA